MSEIKCLNCLLGGFLDLYVLLYIFCEKISHDNLISDSSVSHLYIMKHSNPKIYAQITSHKIILEILLGIKKNQSSE